MNSTKWSWIELGLGGWVLVSPWLLGASSLSLMMWSNLLVGLTLFLLAFWAIFDRPEENSDKKNHA